MNYRGISQRELARMTNTPENTLGRYLNGQSIPRADKIVNIAKALDCTVSELIHFGEMVTKWHKNKNFGLSKESVNYYTYILEE